MLRKTFQTRGGPCSEVSNMFDTEGTVPLYGFSPHGLSVFLPQSPPSLTPTERNVVGPFTLCRGTILT